MSLMKIHTKHLGVCEKGGKFNKTRNTIYNLQEEPIEPTGKNGGMFLCLYLFILPHFGNRSSGCLRVVSTKRMKSIFFPLPKLSPMLCFYPVFFSTQIIRHAARDVSSGVFPKLMVALGQRHR